MVSWYFPWKILEKFTIQLWGYHSFPRTAGESPGLRRRLSQLPGLFAVAIRSKHVKTINPSGWSVMSLCQEWHSLKICLVVWLPSIFYFPRNIGLLSSSNWLSYFSEGFSNFTSNLPFANPPFGSWSFVEWRHLENSNREPQTSGTWSGGLHSHGVPPSSHPFLFRILPL